MLKEKYQKGREAAVPRPHPAPPFPPGGPKMQGRSSHPGTSRKRPCFRASHSFSKRIHAPGAWRASAWPVPPRWGDHAPLRSRSLCHPAQRLTLLHLGCLATPPFFNKTRNKKAGRKGPSTQNRCCPALTKPRALQSQECPPPTIANLPLKASSVLLACSVPLSHRPTPGRDRPATGTTDRLQDL